MTKEDHKEGLLKNYLSSLNDYKKNVDRPFSTLILTKAVNSLLMGGNPKKIENWVVKMEKLYLYTKF